MYLIQKKLAGADIPAALPPSLVPPSMRANDVSPFSPPTSHHLPEPAKDLLWDDTPPASAAPAQPPRSTLLSHAPTSTVTLDPFASAHNGTSMVSSLAAISSYLSFP
jgi:epidermal growth factor receptor substrate 15